MELKFIEKLIKLVKDHEIDSFEYSESGEKLRIVRRHPQPPSNVVQSSLPPTTTTITGLPSSEAVVTAAPPLSTAGNAAPTVNSNLIEVVSPMVGTFYSAPAPDAAPYVNVGDNVQVGQVLCIIEAMKLMNELQSEHSGKMVEILVKNAQPVEFGQPLFRIEPA